MIGHNQPPKFDAIVMHVEDLFQLVSDTTAGAVITTEEQDAALDAMLDDLRQAKKAADAERAAEKKPHDDAAKAVQAKWKPLIERCDAGMKEIQRLLTPFREDKQKAKDEAADKARADAEARTRAAQEALRKSDDLEARFAAEEALKQASKLTAVANRIDRSTTGLRTRYVAEMVDPVAALKHYRETRPDDLKAWLIDQAQRDTNTGARTIPGFAINPERKAA